MSIYQLNNSNVRLDLNLYYAFFNYHGESRIMRWEVSKLLMKENNKVD